MVLALIGGSIALVLSVVAYPQYIKYLNKHLIQQTVSELAVDEFKQKQKTVTFGGVLFVVIPTLISLIYAFTAKNQGILLLIVTFVLYSVLGFIDDYKIVREGKNDGLSEKQKLVAQFGIAALFYILYRLFGGENVIGVPFTQLKLNIGYAYPVLVLFMLVGASNAVNITDGMDGLAGGTSVIALIPFLVFALQQGHMDIVFMIACVMGSLLGFLIYNIHPAQIFMGDVGSLALGALFATLAIVLHQELLLILVGAVFVIETMSVIIQQAYYKRTKKRLFKYTPIHYSFTLSGWRETRVVRMFWSIGLGCALLSILIGLLS